MMNTLPFPKAVWVNLETPGGKLVARFDARRGILEVVERGEKFVFDLAQIVSESGVDSHSKAPPPSGAKPPYSLPPLTNLQPTT